MAISYGANTGGITTATSGSAANSQAYTADAGADVFVAISSTSVAARTLASATYGGVAMTNIATIGHNNVNTFGITYLYRLAGGGSGDAKTLAYSFTQNVGHVSSIFSYNEVASVGVATTSTGSSAAPSIGPISCDSGDVILAVLGTGTGTTPSAITGTSGGTRRSATNGAANWCSLAVIDSTTSGATLRTTQSASVVWSGIALVLKPEAATTTTTINPDAATITVTGSAPSLVATTVLSPEPGSVTVTTSAPKLDVIVTPPGGSLTGALITVTGSSPTLTMSLVTTGATITITGGTPSTAGQAVLTPAAATITISGTAPTLQVSMVPGSATLPVTGGAPVLIELRVLSPVAASVTVTGGTPVVINPITLEPSAAEIVVTGSNPTVTVAVYTPPVPDAEHTLVVRREHRTHVMSGERIHSVRRASRLTEA